MITDKTNEIKRFWEHCKYHNLKQLKITSQLYTKTKEEIAEIVGFEYKPKPRPRSPCALSEEKLNSIVKFVNEGYSYGAIADIIGVSSTTVSRWAKKLEVQTNA